MWVRAQQRAEAAPVRRLGVDRDAPVQVADRQRVRRRRRQDRLARAVEALCVRDRPVDLHAGAEPRDRLLPVRRGRLPCTERRETQSVVLPGAIEEHRPDRGRRSGPGHDLRDGLGDERGLGVCDVRRGLDEVGLGPAGVAGQPHDEPGVSEARAFETHLHGFARGRRHVERSSRKARAGEGRGGGDAHVCPQARPHGVQTLGARSGQPRGPPLSSLRA